MASYIIDISHWNTITDWNKLKSNCSYIIMKATQGTSTVDSALTTYVTQCESKGIPYWVYCYLNKGSEKAQAEFLVKTAKAKCGSHLVGCVLDIEAGSTAAGVQEALDYLAGAVEKCMIYTMYSQYGTYSSVITGRPSNCAWWEARYGKDTGSYDSAYPCHSGADLHQYTSKGSLDGVKGDVDMSRICGSKTESWFKTVTGTGTTTSASTSTSTSSSSGTSAATATGSYKAGDKVTLKNAALYCASSAKAKTNTVSGDYYIWSATGVNNRIRITNSSANVGVANAVTGWIDVSAIGGTTSTSSTSSSTSSTKIDAAKSFNKSMAKEYTVNSASGLNLRTTPGSDKAETVIAALANGVKVRCYGYFTAVSNVNWLCVQVTSGTHNGKEGYVSSKYLK